MYYAVLALPSSLLVLALARLSCEFDAHLDTYQAIRIMGSIRSSRCAVCWYVIALRNFIYKLLEPVLFSYVHVGGVCCALIKNELDMCTILPHRYMDARVGRFIKKYIKSYLHRRPHHSPLSIDSK